MYFQPFFRGRHCIFWLFYLQNPEHFNVIVDMNRASAEPPFEEFKSYSAFFGFLNNIFSL
jgi:hypothetical protein